MPVRMSSSPICVSCMAVLRQSFLRPEWDRSCSNELPHPDKSSIPAAGIQSGRRHRYLSSGTDCVGHALFSEARLGSAGKLAVGGGHVARLLGVRLAFLHEAVESCAGELLLGRLRLAARALRIGAAARKRTH